MLLYRILSFIGIFIILNFPIGIEVFNFIGAKITAFLKLGTKGLEFLFGNIASNQSQYTIIFGTQVAFIISSTVIAGILI